MKNKNEKILAVRLPAHFFNKFKELCDANYKSMSDTIRDFIRERIQTQVMVKYEDGEIGVVSQDWLIQVDEKTFKVNFGSIYNKKCEIVKSFKE